jgi:tetrahydrodipicolinate N-succinyltransferase
VRADDGHPIFDVRTGLRVNPSRSITIGDHVWLGRFATVLGGVSIGEGTVIGYGSVVTRNIPNNCVAAGSPARVVRRDIAWERPHLSLVRPYYKPDASTIKRSTYWNLTKEEPSSGGRRRGLRRLRRWRSGS